MLCSDGLSDMVEETQIETIIRQKTDPQEAASELVKAALENGGRDNVTAMIVKIIAGNDEKQDTANKSFHSKIIVNILQTIVGTGFVAVLSDLIYYLIK